MVADQMASALASGALEEEIAKYATGDYLGSAFKSQLELLNKLREYRAKQGQGPDQEYGAADASAGDRTNEARQHAADAARQEQMFIDAEYPDLADKEHKVRVSIRMHLVLIGFQASEDDLLNIPHETLELWLEHLTSVMPHAAGVPTGQAAWESQATREMEDLPGGSAPGSASVEYVYKYHVVDVAREVGTVVEACLRAHLREDEASATSSGNGNVEGTTEKRMFLPSWRMEELLGPLAAALDKPWESSQHADKPLPVAYTLFVLNPRRAWSLPQGQTDAKYGYRCGLSAQELRDLAQDPAIVQRAEEADREEQKRWRIVHGATAASGMEDFDYDDVKLPASRTSTGGEPQQHRAQVERTDGVDASYKWATEALGHLPAETDSPLPNLTMERSLLLSEPSDATSRGRVRTMLREVLDESRKMRTGDVRDAHISGSGKGSGSGCMSEVWVSADRFAWVDLQAGPFEWGTSSGGQGYKSGSTNFLPRRPSTSPAQSVGAKDVERESVDELRRKIASRVDRMEELNEHLACQQNQANRQEPAIRSQITATVMVCKGITAQLAFLRQFQALELEVWNEADVAARAEGLSVDGAAIGEDGDSPALSDTLRALKRSNVALLKEVVHELAPVSESDSPAIVDDVASGSYAHALLARLAAVVSSLARSVVTPPSTLPLPRSPATRINPAWVTSPGAESRSSSVLGAGSEPAGGSDSERSILHRLPSGPALLTKARAGELGSLQAVQASRGSVPRLGCARPSLPMAPTPALDFFVPEALAFTLYVVRAQDIYPPLGASPGSSGGPVDGRRKGESGVSTSSGFDLAAFQEGAMSLKLPNQRASFTMHQVAADTAPTLLAALAGATREANVNIVTPQGEPHVERRRFIDSARIRHHLKAHSEEDFGDKAGGAREAGKRYTQHVTIFLFSMAGAESVYVDEFWRARAVGGDTVVVAQSERRHDPSPQLTCGGLPVEEDPRNPVRQALAAVGSIVGGLVPAQDSWHEARGGDPITDWTWAMSESPMSPMVPYARFSKIDQDVIYRTHAVRALSASAELTRAGSSVLLEVLSEEASRNILEGPMLGKMNAVRKSLQAARYAHARTVKKLETMSFDDTMQELNPLLDEARRFHGEAVGLEREVVAAVTRRAGTNAETTLRSVTAAEPGASSKQVVIAAVAFALFVWLFERVFARPASRLRHRKRMKVN